MNTQNKISKNVVFFVIHSHEYFVGMVKTLKL